MIIDEEDEEVGFWIGNLVYGAYLVAEASIVLTGMAVDSAVGRVIGRGK